MVVAPLQDSRWVELDRRTLLLVLDAVCARPDWPGGTFSQADLEGWGGPGSFTSQAVLRRDRQTAGGAAAAGVDLPAVQQNNNNNPQQQQQQLDEVEDAQLDQAAVDWEAAFDGDFQAEFVPGGAAW